MDIDIARTIARNSFRSSSKLAALAPVVRENCSPDEGERLCRAIAAVMAEISLTITQPVLDEFPEIQREIDESISRFGKLVD